MITDELNRIFALSEENIRKRIKIKIDEQDICFSYSDEERIRHYITTTTDNVWFYYIMRLDTNLLYEGSLEDIVSQKALEEGKVTISSDSINLRLSNISYIFDGDTRKYIAPLMPTGEKLYWFSIPNISPEKIANFLAWFNNVAALVEKEVRDRYLKFQQDQMIKEILKDSLKVYADKLLEEDAIISYYDYETDANDSFPQRHLDKPIEYPSIGCSFATYRLGKFPCSSEQEVRQLLSNPEVLLSKLDPYTKKPACMKNFSAKEKAVYRNPTEDSFIQEMRELTYNGLRDLGIVIVMSVTKKQFNITAVQYCTSRRMHIDPQKCLEFFADSEAIIKMIQPFHFRTNFVVSTK